MILERGDMWSIFGKTDLFLVTTNPVIRKDGAVVMGRGIALEAKTRFPSLPYDFGGILRANNERNLTRKVGYIGEYESQAIGYFMVKDHFAQPAKTSIIEKSAKRLAKFANTVPKEYRIDLNFPGIGNGKLAREDVLPLLEGLPDNVHIWEYE